MLKTKGDPWLESWLPLIIKKTAEKPILESGCGSGADTWTLTQAGMKVIAFDLSKEAVDLARKKVPEAKIFCQNTLDPFPIDKQDINVIIASLSLHYFSWTETQAIINRIDQTLTPGGIFICRVNSTEDYHFGASGYPEIEPNFYLVEGLKKRFFTEKDLKDLFSKDWKILSLSHKQINKYEHPKAIWELIAEKKPTPA